VRFLKKKRKKTPPPRCSRKGLFSIQQEYYSNIRGQQLLHASSHGLSNSSQ